MKTNKKKLSILILIIFSFFLFSANFVLAEDLTAVNKQQDFKFYKAKIINIEKKDKEKDLLKIELLNNGKKGNKIDIKNDLRANPRNFDLKKGQLVYIYAQNINNEQFYIIQDFYHLNGLVWGLLIAIGLIILFGGKKGMLSFVSLLISLGTIFFVYLPLVMKGWNILGLTLVLSIVISGIVLIFLSGFSKKSLIAFLATLGGIIFSFLMLLLIGKISGLTGFGEESIFFLKANYPNLNFLYFLYGGMIIGVLGAIIDVAVSIVSAIAEINKHKNNITKKELFFSGMNIGRDILGSMINTLVFAYIGSAMAMLLIILKSKPDFFQIFNYGLIAEEIVRILISIIALATVIPLTAFLGGIFLGPKISKINIKKIKLSTEKIDK